MGQGDRGNLSVGVVYLEQLVLGPQGRGVLRASVCDVGEACDTNDIWLAEIGDNLACSLPHSNQPNLSAICV